MAAGARRSRSRSPGRRPATPGSTARGRTTCRSSPNRRGHAGWRWWVRRRRCTSSERAPGPILLSGSPRHDAQLRPDAVGDLEREFEVRVARDQPAVAHDAVLPVAAWRADRVEVDDGDVLAVARE